MPMRGLALVALLGAAGVTSAAAQLVNENLLVTVPDGYKIDFQTKKNNMVMTEMVPSAQTVNDWTEMVTVQVFLGLKATPKQVVGNIARGWLKACPEGQSQTIAETIENGYPILFILLTCPRNSETGKPEYTWFKAIAGNDSFYMVQKAFKFVPEKEQIAQWSRYLRGIMVCDSRLPDRPCPAARQ